MSKTIKAKDSNGHMIMLTVEDKDWTLISSLKPKQSGKVTLSGGSASVEGDALFITQKGRTYDFKKKDVLK